MNARTNASVQDPLPIAGAAETAASLFCSIAKAAEILGMHHVSVSRLAKDGVLTPYTPQCAAGEKPSVMLYVAEVRRVHEARQLLQRG